MDTRVGVLCACDPPFLPNQNLSMASNFQCARCSLCVCVCVCVCGWVGVCVICAEL